MNFLAVWLKFWDLPFIVKPPAVVDTMGQSMPGDYVLELYYTPSEPISKLLVSYGGMRNGGDCPEVRKWVQIELSFMESKNEF
jgi:hypothetical protein